MRRTLLEMTQDILSEMSSDEVNSISDTTESLQVATIIKNKYRDIVARGGIPEHNQLFQLDPSLDVLKPVLMFIPTEVNRLESIKYLDTTPTAGPSYTYVTLLPTDQFLDYINAWTTTNDTTVDSFIFSDDSSGSPYSFTFYYKNDGQPRFATIISNRYVVFDSYDLTQDDTLQATKTLCSGQVSPIFRMEDTFIPELSESEFALLYNEAKALSFYNLKQQANAKAEQEVKRQWTSVQKNKYQNEGSAFDRLPDFGRNTGKIYGTRQFR